MDRLAPIRHGGLTITSGNLLNGPLGLTIAPNGNILTANANDGNIVEPLASSTFQNMVWPALAIPTGGKTYVSTGTKLNPAVGAEDTTMFNESTTYNALNAALRGSGRSPRAS